MVIHTITVTSKTVECLYSGQTVVIACDQPLFAIAKTIQWSYKERSQLEDKLIVMFGGIQHVYVRLW